MDKKTIVIIIILTVLLVIFGLILFGIDRKPESEVSTPEVSTEEEIIIGKMYSTDENHDEKDDEYEAIVAKYTTKKVNK